MQEVWKDIAGYEGLYQVSNLGRVKSCARYRTIRGGKARVNEKEITPCENSKGYLIVGLYKDGKRTIYALHRLVAETFVQNPDSKKTVNHINGDKHDNRVVNLEWNTYTENNNHALSSGLRTNKSQKNNKRSVAVAQYSKNMELVRIYPSMMEAERNGFSSAGISLCCKGTYKTHKGYIWRYA